MIISRIRMINDSLAWTAAAAWLGATISGTTRIPRSYAYSKISTYSSCETKPLPAPSLRSGPDPNWGQMHLSPIGSKHLFDPISVNSGSCLISIRHPSSSWSLYRVLKAYKRGTCVCVNIFSTNFPRCAQGIHGSKLVGPGPGPEKF